MKNIFLLAVLINLMLFMGYQSETEHKNPLKNHEIQNKIPKKEIPILCYHRIREILPTDGENMKTYSVTPASFAAQMQALHENGFQTILPEQLYNYLKYNKPLPPKPVIITFDDGRAEQSTIGANELKKYNFKGVFFIMTVAINKPGYMSKMQIKALSDHGHAIGNHTWDHHSVTKYTPEDWNTQLLKPQILLEKITGKSIHYFSYPFGLWNADAINVLKKQHYKLAFQLADGKPSPDTLFTIKRMIVSGKWSATTMMKNMESTFNKIAPK